MHLNRRLYLCRLTQRSENLFLVLPSFTYMIYDFIILVHNHPSDDPSPSGEDGQETEKIRSAAALAGIDFVDHVIIAGSSFYSYVEEVAG